MSRLRTVLPPYLLAAVAIAAAVALRPALAAWFGDTVAFVVLCVAVAVAVWFIGLGEVARRREVGAPSAGSGAPAEPTTHGSLAATRLLAAIVETSDDAIVSKSLDGIIRSWNVAAERVFGYTADQAVGRHISLIIPPERLAEEEQIVQRLRAGERVDHFETVRVRSDGRRIPVSLTISPIKDDAGVVVGASKIARDISARKEAESLVREKEERLRLATRTGKVGIWEWDPATNRMIWTDSLYTIHGMGQSEFDGTFAAFQRLIHPDDREFVERRLLRCLRDRTACELEFRSITPDGRLVWIYSSVISVEDESRPLRLVGASLDITDRRHAEESLKVADRRKDEFLATLAHELRNPLAPIWTAAQVLKLKGTSDPDLHWSSEIIDRQMRHMVRLLEDLLDVSRISQNKLVLRKEPVDIATVIRVAVETSRPAIDGARHTLVVDLPSQPIRLHGDPVRLAQVFSNLLNNAANYMREGGRIALNVKQHGHRVTVSVHDEGIGITPEMRPHLFQIFSRGSSELRHAQSGLGIGLSLSRALVELHGGTIEARSEGADKGSEFIVTLPLAAGDASALARGGKASANEVSPNHRRLLIVDDLKDTADSLAALMRIKGHEVHTAYDGEAAVEMAASVRPEVIVLDLGLPIMNGYEVCRAVRRLPAGDSIFIVALTGWGQPSDRQRTEDAGFDWHLVKPVDGDALANLLSQAPAMARPRAVEDSR
jgi:PAS domain S-box-containing protein